MRPTWDNRSRIEALDGKVVKFIDLDLDRDDGEIRIECEDGSVFLFHHQQDCCEYVNIVDVKGDPVKLQGYKLKVSEEVIRDPDKEEFPDRLEFAESSTLTTHTFKTTEETLVVKWIGTSNGYYSESVDIHEISR